MKDTEFAYAVARIRSNEARLLSSASIETLINSQGYTDALKILSDLGYDNLESVGEEKALANVLRSAFELIYSCAPDKKCLDFLIVRNDFHNIRALIKCMVAGIDAEKLILSPSVIDPQVIGEALQKKDYSLLPEFASETVKRAYELITTTMDGQTLEVFLDRKSIEASVILAKQSKDEFSIALANLMCAVADIKIALRCLKTNKDEAFTMGALADCALLDKERLCEAVLSGEDALCAYVKNIGFDVFADSIKKGYAAFEKACDDMLMERVKHAKYQCLGIAPLGAYYFAVDAQVKTVRIILSCKKNGLNNENIRERVRVLYV